VEECLYEDAELIETVGNEALFWEVIKLLGEKPVVNPRSLGRVI
jgi:hypothetical protein